MSDYLQKNKRWLLPLCLMASAGLYIFILYGLNRTQFPVFISCIIALFGLYTIIVKISSNIQYISYLLVFSVVIRILLLGVIPNLSDDFYRFVYDGRLLASGQNPYLILPSDYPENSLYSHLNSPHYYTVYPPFNQLLFGIASWIYPKNLLGNVMVLRVIIIVADTINIILLRQFFSKKNKLTALLYAFNPLIIIELTGNIHFEGVMICGLLLALSSVVYQVQSKGKNIGILFTFFFLLSIATKLIPLIFMPLLVRYRGFKNGFTIGFFVAIGFIVLWLPFLDKSLMAHFFSSIDLYFQSFQFNACVYYIVRAIGFWVVGFDIVWWAGGVLALIATWLLLKLSFSTKVSHKLPITNTSLEALYPIVLFILTTYFLFATTVHPWYITTIFTVSLLTAYRFAIVWSFMVFLSYSAYTQVPVNENLSLIFLEYFVVISIIVYELKFKQLWSYPHQK